MNTLKMKPLSELNIPFHEHVLTATLLPGASKTGTDNAAPRGCVLYLHGGGLVFGERRDLPALYTAMFREAGFDLVSLSYPLAPESPLTEILSAVHTSVSWLLTHPKALGYEQFPPYFLFGRSAGAYLALAVAAALGREAAGKNADGFAKTGVFASLPQPAGLLCFYGYRSFLLPEFSRPSAFYQKMPPVSEKTVKALAGQGFLTEGPLASRYALYVYARQTGSWPRLLGTQDELAACALTDADLALLPPGFFTASSGDQDVPFRESKQLGKSISGSVFHPVYFLEHDFDRDTARPEGPKTYRAALSWMENRLRSLPVSPGTPT